MAKLRQLMTLSALLLVGKIGVADSLTIEPISNEREIRAVLDMESNQFAIVGGCNTFTGSMYLKEHDIFRTNPHRLTSTKMACTGAMEGLDQKVRSFLRNKPKMVRKGDALYLVGNIRGESESRYIPVELDKGAFRDIEALEYDTTFLYVSGKPAVCKLGTTESGETCLLVRKKPEDQWEIYKGEIEGFTPNENIDYRLRLKAYPRAEGETRLVLDMIVEQVSIDTKEELDEAGSDAEGLEP